MLSQDIENAYSDIPGENKAWVPMIWSQQVVTMMRQGSWGAESEKLGNCQKKSLGQKACLQTKHDDAEDVVDW